jgi:hypothetical protein
MRTSTNVSWTQNRHGLEIKGIYVPANHWILLVFLAICRTKTLGENPESY